MSFPVVGEAHQYAKAFLNDYDVYSRSTQFAKGQCQHELDVVEKRGKDERKMWSDRTSHKNIVSCEEYWKRSLMNIAMKITSDVENLEKSDELKDRLNTLL